VGIDSDTKKMERGDVARIQIDTVSSELIDSRILVVVLGVKFCIRVMEEVAGMTTEKTRLCGRCGRDDDGRSGRGSGEGGSVVALVEGESVSGDDSDWSESRQEVMVSEAMQGKKGDIDVLRSEVDQRKIVSGCDPTVLGNSLVGETNVVNHNSADIEDLVGVEERGLVIYERTNVVREGGHVVCGEEDLVDSRAVGVCGE
jgi:hypothetical protein